MQGGPRHFPRGHALGLDWTLGTPVGWLLTDAGYMCEQGGPRLSRDYCFQLLFSAIKLRSIVYSFVA